MGEILDRYKREKLYMYLNTGHIVDFPPFVFMRLTNMVSTSVNTATREMFLDPGLTIPLGEPYGLRDFVSAVLETQGYHLNYRSVSVPYNVFNFYGANVYTSGRTPNGEPLTNDRSYDASLRFSFDTPLVAINFRSGRLKIDTHTGRLSVTTAKGWTDYPVSSNWNTELSWELRSTVAFRNPRKIPIYLQKATSDVCRGGNYTRFWQPIPNDTDRDRLLAKAALQEYRESEGWKIYRDLILEWQETHPDNGPVIRAAHIRTMSRNAEWRQQQQQSRTQLHPMANGNNPPTAVVSADDILNL